MPEESDVKELNLGDLGMMRTMRNDLIDEILAMVIAEFLCADDTMKIGLHKLLNEVDFSKLVKIWRPENIEDRDDVLMMKVSEEFDFPERSKTEHGMIEGSDALNCNSPLSWNMYGRAKML
jgi:hypothetical protein